MSKEAIVEKILSDADAEAAEIIRAAEAQAERIIGDAQARAQSEREETEAEVAERAKRISDGREAAARLDSAKVLLAEKRRVIEGVYRRAYVQLTGLEKRECLRLFERLLTEYAEQGDEIVPDETFSYTEELMALPVVKERGLTVSFERVKLGGGFVLRGTTCDKDLSFAALLRADMEEHQAELAANLFK